MKKKKKKKKKKKERRRRREERRFFSLPNPNHNKYCYIIQRYNRRTVGSVEINVEGIL